MLNTEGPVTFVPMYIKQTKPNCPIPDLFWLKRDEIGENTNLVIYTPNAALLR
jgi:hypothetical protein